MPNDSSYLPSSQRRFKPILILIALILTGSVAFYFFRKGHSTDDKSAESAADAAVQVQTATLEKKNLASTVQAFGILMPDVGGAETVSLTVPVQIKHLFVAAGQFVKAGQPLFEIVIDPTAEAAYQQAVTAETLARGELSRTEELLGQQLATQSQVATARKALQDAEATLVAQRSMKADLKGNAVVAAHAGLVSTLSAQQGDRVVAGAAILQLTQSSKLTAQLGLTPEDARLVKPGMTVHITSQFDEQAAGEGVVTQVFGIIDPKTRMVEVVAQLNSLPTGALPGTQVQASIQLSTATQWAVARSAVLTDETSAYVYQIKGEHARRINVTTGIESGDWIGIEGKLDPAEKVVVSGNYELKDGATISEEEKADDKAEAKPSEKEADQPAEKEGGKAKAQSKPASAP